MLKIRLSRQGAKNKPKYRIVVAEKRFKRDGRFLEILGHYDTTTKPSGVTIDKKKLEHWISVGAQPTETVKRLIKQT